MHNKRLFFASALIGLLVFGSISPSWGAADLTANILSSGVPIQSTFKFAESAFIDYPNGGQLKDMLKGKNMTISFTADSNTPGMQDLLAKINSHLVRDLKSQVIVTNATLVYTATLSGDDKAASIDYLIQLVPTLTSYVITKGSGDNPTMIDASWMGLSINDPITIKTAQYGDVEINIPANFLQKVAPDVYSKISSTPAGNALNNNLMDASQILQEPLDSWNHLFDPAYTLSETSGFGYKGEKIPITTYAMGQSGISEGILKPKINTVPFTLDTNYDITTVQHTSSATVNIDGHANTSTLAGEPVFATTPQAIGGTSTTSSGGFPAGVVYAMAAFGAIVAGGVLFWSNKKLKSGH